MDVSILIVNYNGKKYLSDCLSSIEKQCHGISYEIIIWDNDSKDDSVAFLKEHYKDKIQLYTSQENLGFAGGNNAAAKYAKGKYLFLLNNDTILLDPIAPLINLMEKDKKIGVLGTKMLNGDKKYTVSCGQLPKPYQLFYFKSFSQIGGPFVNGNFNNSEDTIEVGWLSGSFLITPKKLWDDIGGLDESFFMYVEDVDYNKEIESRGYKRVFCPNSEYIHFVGFNNTKNDLLVKGYHLYINKHFKRIDRLIARVCLNINTLVKKLKGNL